MEDEMNGPSLTLDDGVPAIVFDDGTVRRSGVTELFETGGGVYLAYAEGWREKIDEIYPDGWQDFAASVADEYGLTVSDEPSLWLLVAMTLED